MKNSGDSNIGKVSSLPLLQLWRVNLSMRTAAHDATATTLAYTTTTTTTTNNNPTGAASVSLAKLHNGPCRGPQ